MATPTGPQDRIGPYRITGELGRGGMGIVYRARRDDLNREFALKVILQGQDATSESVVRFRREAQAAARLAGHPGIVGVHDIGEDAGRVYFAMDLVEGRSLEERLDDGVLQPAEAARVIAGAARAIAHAHGEGILHRDIKPGNLLLSDGGTAQVSDFGLAVSRDAEGATRRLTLSGVVLGTPSYMPPEQARGGALDARADVYALGATLYEALLGVPPFAGDSLYEVIHAVLRDDPVPLRRRDPRVPRDLETIVMRCLEKDPAQRYATADALADDLERFLRDEPIRARRPSMVYRIRKAARRHPAAVAAAALAVAGFAAYFGGPGWVDVRGPAGTESRTVWPAVTQTLRAVWPDHQPQSAEVPVRPWSTVHWAPPVLLDHGFLAVTTAPAGAEVRIELPGGSEIRGQSGGAPIRLPVGTFRIQVSLRGHADERDAVTVRPGATARVEKSLVPLRGTLTMTCRPSAVRMTLIPEREEAETRARAVYSLPIKDLQVPVGRYRVRLRKENHFPRETTITVPLDAQGRPARVTGHASLSAIALWRDRLSGSCVDGPCAADFDDDGNLDIAWPTTGGEIEVFRGLDGTRLWRRSVGAPIRSEPSLASVDADGVPDILVADARHRLIALRGRDGRELWRRQLPGETWGAPAVGDVYGDGVSYAATAGLNGHVQLQAVTDGAVRWSTKLAAGVDSATTLLDVNRDRILDVVVSDRDGGFHALNGRDGAVLWTQKLGESSDYSPALWDMTGDGVPEAIVGTWNGDLLAVDLTDGRIVWTQRYTAWEQPVAALYSPSGGAAPHCVVVDAAGNVRGIEPRSGAVQWHVQLRGATWGTPVITDADNDGHPECYVNTWTGIVHALDASSGAELWRYAFHTQTRAPLVLADVNTDGTPELLLSPMDGRVGVLRTVPPPEQWRRLFDWQPRARHLVDDVDRDGVRDVLIDHVDSVVTVSGRTGATVWNTFLSSDGVRGLIPVADVDGDGVFECFAETESCGCLFSGADGRRLWRTKPLWDPDTAGDGSLRTATAVPAGGTEPAIYLFVPGGHLICLSARSGAELWRARPAQGAFDMLLGDVDGDGTPDAICIERNGTVTAVSGADRSVRWTARGPAQLSRNARLLATGPGPEQLLLLGGRNEAAAVRARDGHVLWRVPMRVPGAAVLGHDGNGDGVGDVYLSGGGGQLALRDARTGTPIWNSAVSARKYQRVVSRVEDRDGDGVPDVLVSAGPGALIRSGKRGFVLATSPVLDVFARDGGDMLAIEANGRELLRAPLPSQIPTGLQTRRLGDAAMAAQRLSQELQRGRSRPARADERRRSVSELHRMRLAYQLARIRHATLARRIELLRTARSEGLRSAEVDALWLSLHAQAGSVTPTLVAELHPETALHYLAPRLPTPHRTALRAAARGALTIDAPIGLLLMAGETERAEAALAALEPLTWRWFAWRALVRLEQGKQAEARRCHAIAQGLEPYDRTVRQLGYLTRQSAPKPSRK